MRTQFIPESLGHWCAGTCVMPVEDNIAATGQAEEIQYGLEGRLRIGPEHAGVHDVNPVPAEEPLQPFELLDVLTAGTVGVVLMAVAEVAGSATMRSASPSRRDASSSKARSNGSVS